MRFDFFRKCASFRAGFRGLLAVACVAIAGQRSSAAPILNVDFGASSSPVETGFQAFGIATGSVTGPVTKTLGGYDVTVAVGTTLTGTGTLTARDRAAPAADSGAFTYSALYRDFINPTTTSAMSIGVAGLTGNTQYKIGLYAYDNSNTKTITFTDYTTGAAGNSGQVPFTAGATFTSNDQFATFFNATTNSAGNLVFRATSNSGGALISGLVIDSVPEPASIGLMSLAALALYRRRRCSRL